MPHFRQLRRGEDTTLQDFEDDLIQKVEFVLGNTLPGEPTGAYKALRESTEELRSNDLASPWPRELKKKVCNSYVKGRKHLKFIFFLPLHCQVLNQKLATFLLCWLME